LNDLDWAVIAAYAVTVKPSGCEPGENSTPAKVAFWPDGG
jgi:hypothetical protein